MKPKFSVGDVVEFRTCQHDADCDGKRGVIVGRSLSRGWDWQVRFTPDGPDILAHSSELHSVSAPVAPPPETETPR